MNKTKFWFGCLIIFFIIVYLLTPIWFNSLIKKNITPIVYNSTESYSCHITITEPTIVLRMDDVRAYSIPTPFLVNEILRENLSVTLGVIPKDIDKDLKIKKYLMSIRENPKIEIAQHGVYHAESDIHIKEKDVIVGNEKIQRILGVQPITYIPPFNKINQSSKIFIEKHFKILSAKEVLKEGKIAEIGKTIGTYDYLKSVDISNEEVYYKCKNSLENTNICVVALHPQEWGKEKLENFDDFKDLLTKLQSLNARFSTFKELVNCYNTDENRIYLD